MKRIVTVVTFQYDFPDDEGYPLENLAEPAPDNTLKAMHDRISSAFDFYLDEPSIATVIHHSVHEVIT